MRIKCPACNQEYEIDKDYFDKKVECACGETFVVSTLLLVPEKTYNNRVRELNREVHSLKENNNSQNNGCAKTGCLTIVIVLLLFYLIGLFSSGTTSKATSGSGLNVQSTLENSLSYLRGIPEVSKMEIHSNDVYLSFKNDKLPFDFKVICNAAASNGSLALKLANLSPTRCSVWVIPESNIAGDVSKYYYSCHARNGKLE